MKAHDLFSVSMPSRASTSFLPSAKSKEEKPQLRCQCPHGLQPHFYKELLGFSVTQLEMRVNALTGFNLISTNITSIYNKNIGDIECQCPHGLQPHFYKETTGDQLVSEKAVSMPSRASTSFLQYPFKNVGFMRFPETDFAGICQNILTNTHFYAC